jgi:glycosyltransferase involved in cell wall biosynthesis
VNILLINHYAGSDRMGMEYRPFYLAREWVAAGHQVTVLAADFSHQRTSQPSVAADLDSTEEEGVRFLWLHTNRYQGNGAARVASILVFVGKIATYAGRIARELRPDIVVCSSTYPLDVPIGALIARKAGAQLVFEVHDLWPLTPILLGDYSPAHPYIQVLQRAEDWAYRHVDRVVSILPDARGYMAARGLDPRKFVHIPNGVVVSQANEGGDALPAAIERLIAEERGRGRFLIGYAGGINLGMALDTMLEAASPLASSGIAFFVAGDGAQASALHGRLRASSLDNFHMLGPIAKSAIQSFLSRMDALAIPWRRSPLYRYGMSPNKLFDYMLAGKPILQAAEASNDLVADANCGFTVEPQNPMAFAGAALRLQALGEEERRQFGANGRRFVLAHHDYCKLARRFLDALESPRVRPSRVASESCVAAERPSPGPIQKEHTAALRR